MYRHTATDRRDKHTGKHTGRPTETQATRQTDSNTVASRTNREIDIKTDTHTWTHIHTHKHVTPPHMGHNCRAISHKQTNLCAALHVAHRSTRTPCL